MPEKKETQLQQRVSRVAPPDVDARETVLHEPLNDALRELREEVQDLSRFIGGVKSGLTSIAAGASYIEKTVADIEQLFTRIEKENQERHDDTIRHITNLWEQMQVNPLIVAPRTDLPQQEQLHALTLLEEQIREIVFAVGLLTIPHRLNRWLEVARIGYYVPFHALFEDELPDPEDRQRVLRNIALAPKCLKAGIVCRSNGLIYRYNPSRMGRTVELILVSLLFLGVSALVWLAGHFQPMEQLLPLEPQVRALLLPAWVAILLGILVHVAVARVKRDQESSLPPIMAVKDWMLLFSARKGDIMFKMMQALIGLFALAFLLGKEQFTISGAFLVGYSLDSFIGMFGESMGQRATAHLATLRKRAGLESGS